MLHIFFSSLSARAILINDKYVSDIYKQNDSSLYGYLFSGAKILNYANVRQDS